MGEVYRARDPRLERDVAIKVLPASFSQDADRLRRFEQEAQAAGRPEPPQHHRGLRHRRARRRALRRPGAARGRDAALAARGRRALAAQGDRLRAPDRARARRRAREGHRPPRPEAREHLRHERRPRQDPRLRPRQADADREARGQQTNLPTATAGTEPGVVMGTLGYMSPEQVRGKPADARADIFCLRRDPLRDALGPARVPRRLGRRDDVRDPQGGSAGPLGRRTRTSRPASSASCATASRRIPSSASTRRTTSRSTSRRCRASSARAPAPPARTPPAPRVGGVAAAIVAVARPRRCRGRRLLGCTRAGPLRRRRLPPAHVPPRHDLDRRASARTARRRLLRVLGRQAPRDLSRVARQPGARPLGLPNADVLAVSPSGRARRLAARPLPRELSGRHARALAATRRRRAAGDPRERRVGRLVARRQGPRDRRTRRRASNRLEYPIGKVLYETRRLDRQSALLAPRRPDRFIDHPTRRRRRRLPSAIVDLAGKKTTSRSSTRAWRGSPGRPTARRSGSRRPTWAATASLHAVTPAGRVARRCSRHRSAHGRRTCLATDGLLLAHSLNRIGLAALAPGDQSERDLSWFDWSLMADLSQRRPHGDVQRDRRGRRPGLLGLPARDRWFARRSTGRGEREFPVAGRQAGALHRASDGRQQIPSIRPVRARRRCCLSQPSRAEGGVAPGRAPLPHGGLEKGHGFRVYLVDSEGGIRGRSRRKGSAAPSAGMTASTSSAAMRSASTSSFRSTEAGGTLRCPGSSRATRSSVRAIVRGSSTCAGRGPARPHRPRGLRDRARGEMEGPGPGGHYGDHPACSESGSRRTAAATRSRTRACSRISTWWTGSSSVRRFRSLRSLTLRGANSSLPSVGSSCAASGNEKFGEKHPLSTREGGEG